jgi:uncharacterized protein (TIGR02646 family)
VSHIEIREPDDKGWIRRATGLLAALDAAADRPAREAIIDANSRTWGELKKWLMRLSHNKCWFSEAKDCFNHWDVEHYRPKKAAKDEDGTKSDAYWWLAFDWQNLRICGNVGNRKKGTFFPLRPGSARATRHSDVRLEDPLLLDPAKAHDASLISFNLDGDVVVAPELKSSWDKQRVEYTVTRCHLDYPQLADKRRVVWADCWARIQQYRQDLEYYISDQTNDVARNSAIQAADQIRAMLRPDAELSAVARACILGSGDSRVVRLLQVM